VKGLPEPLFMLLQTVLINCIEIAL